MSRFLVTTALEETWPEANVPVLFLGDWCRRFVRQEQWSHRDAVVLPYHWDDRARLAVDYAYLLNLHERLLSDLSVHLNQIHGVDHGVRYWRILVGPWLGYFTQMLYDRWSSIQQAVAMHDLSATVVLADRNTAVVPNDMAEFISFFVGDHWNHHIYASILQQFTAVPCTLKLREYTVDAARVVQIPQENRSLKRRLADWFAEAASVFAGQQDAFLLGTSLPLMDELKMYVKLGHMPQRWRSAPCATTEIDASQRQWILAGDSQNSFEVCARALVVQQLPAVYLEGYARLTYAVSKLPWPKHPKLIWSSNSFNADDVFKAWAAHKADSGTAIVCGQHGGHYGVGRWSFNEAHDLAISDRYLSWGWSAPGQPKVKPVGQLNSKRPLGVSHSAQRRALLVTATMPQHSYVMYSAMVSRQWLDYFEDQCIFVGLLPQPIQDVLTVRLYSQDYGWSQRARWNERLPKVRLDDGSRSIDSLIRESRLYISTYNATTYLESFTMNVPTVIYWNPRHWELRDSAIPYFEDLQRVGIFHETPESAALHVAKIWADVDTWWNGAELRDVLERFKAQYCYLPDNLLTRVQTALRDATLGLGTVKTRIDD
jgi:putative transferase (TIGR04331 family)